MAAVAVEDPPALSIALPLGIAESLEDGASSFGEDLIEDHDILGES